MKRHFLLHKSTFYLISFLLAGILLGLVSVFIHYSVLASDSSTTVTVQVDNGNDDVNEEGNSYESSSSNLFVGTGQTIDVSYTGMRFNNVAVPKGALITSAHIEVLPIEDAWINMGINIAAEDSGNASSFSQNNKPSHRRLTSNQESYSSNEEWAGKQWFAFEDIKSVIQEIVSRSDWQSGNSIAIILKGTADQWGRKFVGSAESGNGPKLSISYSTNTLPLPSVTSTQMPTVTISTSPTAITITPTRTSSPIPTTLVATPTNIPNNTPPPGNGLTSLEYGTWTPKTPYDTCSKVVHDSYYVIGDDGKKYSTWHPQKDPSGCVFGHEHGDDPRTSNVDNTLPAFGYAAEADGMFEPHPGFKVFVADAGERNDEGRTNLHNSRIVFHMGTGGPKRFTTQFHSMEYKVTTNDGRKMFVQGLADIGQVGTICDDPRNQRTVMGFGCVIDSAYEIWENVLSITNNGQAVANAIASTAVFDSITVMDPIDKTKLVYAWDPLAKAQIFIFGDDRSYYRGCEREAYHGPTAWYNTNGSTIYYTDAYGKVVPNGPLKQEISKHGYIDFKATNDGLSQFKFRKSYCVNGLGLSN